MDLFELLVNWAKNNLDFLTLVGLVVTNMLMIRQNQIARRTSDSQNLLDVITFLQDEETRTARRHVLQKLKKKKRSEWAKDDFRHADKVCATYDIAGRLMRSKYVDPEIFLDDWGNSIRRCYLILQDHLNVRRKQAGKRQWDDFQWLYNQVVKWENAHGERV